MTQPFDRAGEVDALREIDEENGEFWVGNPWLFPAKGENLSAWERNLFFLNARDGTFLDLTFASGADSDGDARSVTSADVTGDGMPELFVRQIGGGPLRVYANRFPPANWLNVSLRGTESNSFGIGAKVTATVGDLVIRRELQPHVNFLSQDPAMVHLGLGNAKKIDRLQILWPSGKEQEFTDVAVNRHLLIREGDADPRVVTPGEPGSLAAPR